MARSVAVMVLAAACTSNTSTTTTLEFLPPPPNPDGAASTTQPASETTTPEVRAAYAGSFPDGDIYTVFMEGVTEERLTGIDAIVVFESAEGPIAAGITRVLLSPPSETTYSDGVLTVRSGGAGGWVIDFYPHVLEELGVDADSIITSSFRGTASQGLPGMDIFEPFRWATPDDEFPGHMEVTYESFVVRKGCSESAVACSDRRGAQVIPIDRVQALGPPFLAESVIVGSSAPRPTSDPYYVDPGPLTARREVDLLWSGAEMIIWGGTEGGRPQAGGAILDPGSETWQLFDGPSLENGTRSRAVWRDDEMLVITPLTTFAGDPIADTWADVGAGYPLLPNDPTVVIGDSIYAWGVSGIVQLDSDFEWTEIPDPGFGDNHRTLGYLVDFGGNLVATGLFRGSCESRRTAIWTGSVWTELETISFGTCPWANQTAVVDGELVMWSTRADPTYIYDVGELAWGRNDSIPVSEIEDAPNPLVMGDRLLAPRPSMDALFDVASRTWQLVDVPGNTGTAQMVWTGSEVLAWQGGGMHADAWRWEPPEG